MTSKTFGFLQPGGTRPLFTDLPHKHNPLCLTWALRSAFLVSSFLIHINIQTHQHFLMQFVLCLKGTRACCGKCIPFLHENSLHFVWSAGSCSREMHLCSLGALQRSIPCAFCVLSSVWSHGKDGSKKTGVLLQMGIKTPLILHVFIAPLILFFFSQQTAMSQLLHQGLRSCCSRCKKRNKLAALLPREGTTRQLKTGMEANKLYLRHQIFLSWECSITVISNNHISNRSFPYLPSPLGRMESASLKPPLPA